MLPVINALEVQKGTPAMKKNNTELENPRRRVVRKNKQRELTIGVDLGDKTSRYCVLDREGNVLFERSTATTKKGLAQAFASMGASRIAMEVGTHSPWVKRLLESWNHEVIVANAHRVRLITESTRKDDRLDARKLARLARVDPELLSPIRHRSVGAQAHLVMIRARAALEARTKLVNSARGVTKSFGERLPSCDPDQMRVKCLVGLPSSLQSALQPPKKIASLLTACIVFRVASADPAFSVRTAFLRAGSEEKSVMPSPMRITSGSEGLIRHLELGQCYRESPWSSLRGLPFPHNPW